MRIVLIKNIYKKQFQDIVNFLLQNSTSSMEVEDKSDMSEEDDIEAEEDVRYVVRHSKNGLLISFTDENIFKDFRQFLVENQIVMVDMDGQSSKRKNEDKNEEDVESSESGKRNKKFDVELHKLEQGQTLEEYIEDTKNLPKKIYDDSDPELAIAKLQKIAYILENRTGLLNILNDKIPTANGRGVEQVAVQEIENVRSNDPASEVSSSVSQLQQVLSLLGGSSTMLSNRAELSTEEADSLLKQLQKIIKPTSSSAEETGVKAKISEEIKYAKINDENNRRRVRVLAELLEERIQKHENKSLDDIIADIKANNKRDLSAEHFHHVKDELSAAEEVYREYPAELERRKLLHENVADSNTTRIDVLDAISTILRPYREEIKEMFGPDAQIKFRGSLVRGLKAYPKEGVAPTLDNYDCDAFIEVSDEWWSELKRLNPAAEMQKEGSAAVSYKPLRDYESASHIIVGHQGKNRPKPKTEMVIEDEKSMREKLHRLLEIEDEIKAKILVARGIDKRGRLGGYSMQNETTPDFELYIRPHRSVEHLYTEGNPYPRYMIENRGYPTLAQVLEEKEVKEFRPDQYNRFKRNVIPTFLNAEDYRKPKAVSLEEYQVVIGSHTWYVEDKYLFQWKQHMYQLAKINNKLDASRRGLPIYSESLPLVERIYLHPQNLASTEVIEQNPRMWIWGGKEPKKRSEQEAVNDYFERAYKRRPLGWRRTSADTNQSNQAAQSKPRTQSSLSKKSTSLDAANKNLYNQKGDPSYQLQSHDINYIGEYLFRNNGQYPKHYFLPVQQSHLNSLPSAGLHASLQGETVQEALNNGDSILSVFNRGANHWIAFKITKTNEDQLTIYYKDSLGEDRYHTGKGAKCAEFEEEVIKAFPGKKINFVHSVLSEQRVNDSVNCGIFALENLKCLAKEKKLDHCVEDNAFNENIVFYKPQNDYDGTLQQARAAYAQIYKIRSDEMLENAELRGKSVDFWQNQIANPCLEIFTGADSYLLDMFNAGEFKVEAQFKFNTGEEWRLNLIFKQSMNKDVAKMEQFLAEKGIQCSNLQESGITKLVINASNAEKLLDQLRVNPESAAIYSKSDEQKIKLQ